MKNYIRDFKIWWGPDSDQYSKNEYKNEYENKKYENLKNIVKWPEPHQCWQCGKDPCECPIGSGNGGGNGGPFYPFPMQPPISPLQQARLASSTIKLNDGTNDLEISSEHLETIKQLETKVSEQNARIDLLEEELADIKDEITKLHDKLNPKPPPVDSSTTVVDWDSLAELFKEESALHKNI